MQEAAVMERIGRSRLNEREVVGGLTIFTLCGYGLEDI